MKKTWLGLMALVLSAGCSGTELELGVKELTGGSAGSAGEGGGSELGGSGGAPRGGATSGGATSGGATNGGVSGGGTTSGGRSSGGASGSGAAAGSGGKGGVFKPPADWTELTLGESGGFVPPPTDDSECDLSRYQDTYHVDATSREFAYDYCDGSQVRQVIRKGAFSLSDGQLMAVSDAVAMLGPQTTDQCGEDKGLIVLDLATPTLEYRLADEFYACNPAPDMRTFVSNIDPLANLLRGYTREAPLPPAHEITLTSQGGFAPMLPDAACQPSKYLNTYVANLDTNELSWDLCAGDGTPNSGMRDLSAEEHDALDAAYRGLRPGARGLCGADKPLISARVETDTGELLLADDFYSCSPAPDGATFVRNIDDLYRVFAAFVAEP